MKPVGMKVTKTILSPQDRRALRLRALDCLLALDRLSGVVDPNSAICDYYRLDLRECERLLGEVVDQDANLS